MSPPRCLKERKTDASGKGSIRKVQYLWEILCSLQLFHGFDKDKEAGSPLLEHTLPNNGLSLLHKGPLGLYKSNLPSIQLIKFSNYPFSIQYLYLSSFLKKFCISNWKKHISKLKFLAHQKKNLKPTKKRRQVR